MDQDRIDMIFANAREASGLVYNQTSLTYLGFAVLLLLGLATLNLPKKHRILPLAVLACFIPAGQRIVVFSCDFTILRILVLFGWARVLTRREDQEFSWKTIDKLFIAWTCCSAAAYILLRGTSGAIIFKLGHMFDALGLYFLFRLWIQDWADLFRIIRYFMILSIPVALFFFIEQRTGRNLFSVLGGVPAITGIRDGRLRCQGAYVHPIAAGVFWASMFPLFMIFLIHRGKETILAFFGIISSLLIVVFCASSTPVASTAAAIAAICLYPFRKSMRLIRWGAVITIVGLHFSMEAPVWALIGRTDLAGGSTGYHRFQLVDQTIRRVGEWWALGTTSTAGWGHFLFDVANQYVSEAVRGGLITLVLFLCIIGFSFRGVSRMARLTENDPLRRLASWLVGVSLFSHCTSFVALHYSHQTSMVFYMIIAITASLSPRVKRAARTMPIGRFPTNEPLVRG